MGVVCILWDALLTKLVTLCIFFGCGGELAQGGAQRVLFGREASLGVSDCDRMLRPRVGKGDVGAGRICGSLKGRWNPKKAGIRSQEAVVKRVGFH